jgi:hypothetical protein
MWRRLMLYNETFLLNCERDQSLGENFNCEVSFTPQSILLHDVYMCYGLLRFRIFLLCIPLSTPSPSVMRPCERWWQTRDAVWSQNPDVILQDKLLLKGTKINCSYILIPKVLWCLCYILVQFPSYFREQDWNVSQMFSYVAGKING